MKCENCECQFFEDIRPCKIDPKDFRVYSPSYKLETITANIPIAKCISCGYLHIPFISMNGKNTLSPDYQFAKTLHEEIFKINERIKNVKTRKSSKKNTE